MKLEWKDSEEGSTLRFPELVVYLTKVEADHTDEVSWYFELLMYGVDSPIIDKHFHAHSLADAKISTIDMLCIWFDKYKVSLSKIK